MAKLPNICKLPSSIQDVIMSLCSTDCQRTLAHISHSFRAAWKRQLPGRPSSACTLWRNLQLLVGRNRLQSNFTAQVMSRNAVTGGPCYVQDTAVLHCHLDCHFDRRQLAYILSMDEVAARELGHNLCKCVTQAFHGNNLYGNEILQDAVLYLTFSLTIRRSARLSDEELERLESVFACLPACFVDWAGLDARYACELRWQLCLPSGQATRMHWEIPLGNGSPAENMFYFAADLKFGS